MRDYHRGVADSTSAVPVPPSRPRAYAPLTIAVAVLVTAAVIALGVVAGGWQYGRYQARADAVEAFDAAEGIPPEPLRALIASGELSASATGEVGTSAPASIPEWRSVTVVGEFDQDSVTALRGRTVDGVAALQYLAWFHTADGPLLVNVGWAPRDEGLEVTLPTGSLEIEGIVRKPEADDGREGDGATRIVASQVPYGDPTASYPAPLPAWLMLREPCDPSGCVDTALQPVPVPQLGLGPHLSYAFQWWLLALLAPFAAMVLLRRDARLEREAQLVAAGESMAAASPAPAKRRQRGLTDEEIEDAL